jgi:poly(A) polymerase
MATDTSGAQQQASSKTSRESLIMPIRDLPSLAGEAWLNEPRLQAVMRALNAQGETRVAGGAVRNALLGVPVADIDLATILPPQDVMRIAKAQGFGVHPTGIDHGTVTVTHHGAAFEITTLRKDVETDGRHAVVSFSQDWQEDAARRDFRFNAMYCDATGQIYDFTKGYADVLTRKVRFVGTPAARIKEDYLRILRFFRFQAHYGKGSFDKAGFEACARLRNGLKKLSAERVRQELLKLLAAPAPAKILKRMAEAGILRIILPHTDEWRIIDRLPPDAMLRLFVLAKQPNALQERLRLSNAEAARISRLGTAPHLSLKLLPHEQQRLLYHLGPDAWGDSVHLARSHAVRGDWQPLLNLPDQWQAPVFPIKGADIIAAGIQPGPKVGEILANLEDWWLASDFKPSRDDLLARIGRYSN